MMNRVHSNGQPVHFFPRSALGRRNSRIRIMRLVFHRYSRSCVRSSLCVLTLIALASSISCSRSTGTVGAVPVTGVVTYQEKPVEGAVVVFGLGDGAQGRSASGVTNSSGKFQLMTAAPGDGAMPGTYAVFITKTEYVNLPTEAEREEYKRINGAGAEPPVELRHLLPERYCKRDTSGLTAEVSLGKSNTFKFELVD